MKATEKAYLAGLIDGEGSIMICNPFPLQLVVSISQDERRVSVLDWVKEVFVMFKDYNHTSSGYDPNSDSKVKMIAAKGLDAKKIILKMLPYLILKKPQARLGIAFQILKTERRNFYRHVSNGERVDKEYDNLIASVQTMMKKMNHRGNGYAPVAETERENLISRCRAKAQEIRERQSTLAGL